MISPLLEKHPAIARIAEDLLAEIEEREGLAEVEERVHTFSLADAIRAGSKHTEKATTWVSSDGRVCALSAAALAVKARESVDG